MSAPRPLPRLPDETEKEWARVVVDYAHLQHWTAYHPWLSIRSTRGWPDWVLCRPPRLILAELKTRTGKVTPAQRNWLDLLAQVPGIETYLWRPADWPDVERILA
jgi:hypothetical protein